MACVLLPLPKYTHRGGLPRDLVAWALAETSARCLFGTMKMLGVSWHVSFHASYDMGKGYSVPSSYPWLLGLCIPVSCQDAGHGTQIPTDIEPFQWYSYAGVRHRNNQCQLGGVTPLQVHFEPQDPFTAGAGEPAVLFCTSGGLLGRLSTAAGVSTTAGLMLTGRQPELLACQYILSASSMLSCSS